MPFTPCHPAAVIPLARWGLPVPALVIGSIAPDIPMMLPIPAVVHFAHTWPGLVTLDVAIGVAAFVAWQAFLGPAVIAVAPMAKLPERLSLYFGWRVVAAVLLGAVTHLVWDGFTHDWMFNIPWLTERHGPLLGWQWAQHVSNALGLAVIAGWVILWWRRAPERPKTTVIPLRYRVAAWTVILVPAAICFLVLLLRDSFYPAITRAAGLALIGLAVVAGWVHIPKTVPWRR